MQGNSKGRTRVAHDGEGRAERECRKRIECFVDETVRHFGMGAELDPRLISQVCDEAQGDLHAVVLRDPAARLGCDYVLGSYLGFKAVLAHRIAAAVWRQEGLLGGKERRTLARRISEVTKVAIGVEIHPGAAVGSRLVIDHGYGTVIGETARLGDDCYLLQGVVLGALGVADNVDGRRHPTLGDRVEVGGFARILGNIRVGNDASIGGLALVLRDVPDGARVTVNPGASMFKARHREPDGHGDVR